jgi:hypothetical protein
MANDFSGDSNCIALFKFDNDVLDSKGGNNLTAVNSPSFDSSDKKEGTYCIDLEEGSSQYCKIVDADLDAGFPGKSGTGEQSFSICCWIKPESIVDYHIIIAKHDTTTARTFGVYLNSSGVLYFRIGYNAGASYTNLAFNTALGTGKWYHVAVAYSSSDNGMKIRVWDDDAGALLDDNKEGTASGDMSPTTSKFKIGAMYDSTPYYFDGKIDEVVIFNKVLSDDDIDSIRAGTYGTGVTEKTSSDSGFGADVVDSLQTPQAKTSSDTGSGVEALFARRLAAADDGGGIEASSLETDGLFKDLLATEVGEGSDLLTAKIEMPTKGGGMKLWT